MLNVTDLIGFGAGGDLPAVVSYIGSNSSPNNNTAYTFTAQNIGTASSDRIVVVGTTSNGNSLGISGITLGGSAMTKIAEGSNSNHFATLYYLAYPTGATADIVVTWGDGKLRCGIVVYTITKALSATPTHSNSAGASSTIVSTTINYNANGVVIGVSHAGANTTTTWTNLTEDSDFVIESANNLSSASKAVSGSATGETITSTSVSSSNRALVVASWR